jgi:adenylate cyclase
MERRLAAILAADVVGYSRLMEQDEAGTLTALGAWRKDVLDPLIERHHGRLIKLMGDGVLVEFPSAVNAVACSVELQRAMETANLHLPEDRRILLRVGVNLGDLVVEGGDLYGDGLNIAARLEALADPGSVFLSHTVFSHVRGKVPFGFEDLGEHNLKNIVQPVRVYRVSGALAPAARAATPSSTSKPSIAVLPFANVSGDPEQEYFSDGITEDIIIDLSKVSTLNVLSRNTTFGFKGRPVDIGRLGRQLNVGYVLEGSVRKAGERVRITAQLIDAGNDSHIWAERYDRQLNDIFALQDEISQAIVAALKVKLLPDEKKAIERCSTHDAKSYQLYLLARYHLNRRNVRDLEIALRFCQEALEIDPQYVHAWALVALCQAYLHIAAKSEESGLSAADKALSLDPTVAEAHAARGRVLAGLGRHRDALAAHEESLRLDPNSFDVRYNFGRTCAQIGRHEAAIEHLERASALLDTDYVSLSFLAQCYSALNRHDEAKSAARRLIERIEKEVALRPDQSNAMAHGAIALARLGEKERAKEWASRALTMEPDDAVDHYNVACALAQMNETDQALDLLEACVPKLGAKRISWIKQDNDLKPLHDHPRYQALIAQGEARLAALLSEGGPPQ